MLIDENMRKEVTPKRVYAVLKLIGKKNFTVDEIYELIQPDNLVQDKAVSHKVVNYVIDKKLVNLHDNKLILNFEKKNLDSIKLFRKYFGERVFQGDEKNTFFDFTRWYLEHGDEILKHNTVEKVVANQGKFIELEKEFSLMWKIWAVFLGIGSKFSKQIIPNPYIRIQYMLESDKQLVKGKYIRINEFINWCLLKCPELRDCVEGRKISFAFSLALRTLHDANFIKLKYSQDSDDIWLLYKTRHELEERISDVMIGVGENNE